MKAILSFIAATILYVALGVFAWKVVCGNMDVDWMSYTMSDLAMFKMTAYSVVTAIITTIGVFIKGKVNEEKWYLCTNRFGRKSEENYRRMYAGNK